MLRLYLTASAEKESTMTKNQLTNLLRIAESAPRFSLDVAGCRSGVTRYDPKTNINLKVIEYCRQEWAEFFATFDPPMVIELIKAARNGTCEGK